MSQNYYEERVNLHQQVKGEILSLNNMLPTPMRTAFLVVLPLASLMSTIFSICFELLGDSNVNLWRAIPLFIATLILSLTLSIPEVKRLYRPLSMFDMEVFRDHKNLANQLGGLQGTPRYFEANDEKAQEHSLEFSNIIEKGFGKTKHQTKYDSIFGSSLLLVFSASFFSSNITSIACEDLPASTISITMTVISSIAFMLCIKVHRRLQRNHNQEVELASELASYHLIECGLMSHSANK